MKTFDEIYNELQNSDNNELNNLWKEAKAKGEKANKISLTICLTIDILAIIIFLYIGTIFKSLFALMFIVAPVLIANIFVYVIVNLIFSGKEKNKYNEKYKEVVIKKLMTNFYDNLEYFPQKEMPEYIYEEAKYNEYYDNYESEDYFEAQIDNKYSMQMAEILTQEEQEYENSEGETETRMITKFHGLFAKIVIDKSLNSELKIMQNGGILKSDRLNMDSSEFEKHFDVQASNQIIGMQLLTADVMQELIDFKNNTNMDYDIIIRNSNIYLRFHCEDMFETGNLKKEPLNKEMIKKYFYMLNFTYNVSKRLIDIINETQI